MFQSVLIKDVRLKLGEWCKQQRQAHHLSQEELADLLGMSRITIQKLESGKNATVDTVLKVVNHFGQLQTVYQFIDQTIQDNNIPSLY
jgi:transcriptional regulator with XRE-family HTH domain